MLAARLHSLAQVRAAAVGNHCSASCDPKVADSRRSLSCLQAATAAATSHLGGSRALSDLAAGAAHDKILLRGLVFHGYHGVFPEVRGATGACACLATPTPD